jgi:hypothetical protein
MLCVIRQDMIARMFKSLRRFRLGSSDDYKPHGTWKVGWKYIELILSGLAITVIHLG